MSAQRQSSESLPPDIPAEAVPFLEEAGYLLADPVRVGDAAPDVPLTTPDGRELRLRDLLGRQPVVLVFGSHT